MVLALAPYIEKSISLSLYRKRIGIKKKILKNREADFVNKITYKDKRDKGDKRD